MKDLDVKIGLIHGSQALTAEVLRIAKKKNYIVLVETCGTDTILSAGKRMEAEGVDVIVSRRHTANILSSNLNIPVLSIPITFFDIYRSILKVSRNWESILLPIYADSNEKNFMSQKIVNANIFYYQYKATDEMEKAILWGKEQGCRGVVAGGPVYQKIAMRHGMEYEEIVMNTESVESTLREAYKIVVNFKREKEQTHIFKTIINMGSQYVIAVNHQGDINIVSNLAKKLLIVKGDQKYPHNIRNIMPIREVLNAIECAKPLNHHMRTIGDEVFLINYTPVQLEDRTIGGIVTLQRVDTVMKVESKIGRKMITGFTAKYSIDDFIYCSPKIDNLIKKVKQYAADESAILITGATGTGKEIMAHAIHQLSKRKGEPFISINCASIPEQLLESELFGYEEGAFTGAVRGGKIGLFELAHKGTIFLDEIGSMPSNLQARLLRILQEQEIMRIGGNRLIPIDVRVISATNKDLKQLIAEEQFREDLFFRINILSLYIPPLRERIQDIPLLVKKLTERLSRNRNVPIIEIPDKYVGKLLLLSWPGNVRELSSFLERLVIICDGNFSSTVFEKLYMEFYEYSRTVSDCGEPIVSYPIDIAQWNQKRRSVDHNILKVLKESKYNKKVTAQRLGISRVTLWRKMKKLSF
jgi:transcriptional regulator, propionate catabolism operon regulatory protein